ncbi:hypothetical protein [Cerasicoccus frondis]|uniref:hypothetical protein n=1 Tax=Cerasicoccus frondis TaxID=490090 RepID=UPI0028524CA0|nr:hypothetical protein [Cerasicoccus frondis]
MYKSNASPLSRLALLTCTIALSSASLFGLSGKIDKDVYGIGIERDEFFAYVNSAQGDGTPTTELHGWLDELGVGHIRTSVPPFYGSTYNANKSTYDNAWSDVTDFCEQYGYKITFHFNTSWWSETADREAVLAAFRAKVAQYKGKVHYYELGNEVDIPLYNQHNNIQGKPWTTIAQHKEWLIDYSQVIREEDPGAKIIMASMAGASHNGKIYGWLEEMLDAGCGAYVDYYSLHTYSHNSASNPANDNYVTLIQAVRDMVDAANAPFRPLLITEGGYALSGPYAHSYADSGYQQRWNTQRLIRFWAKDIADIYPVERVDTFILKDYAAEPYGFGMLSSGKVKRWHFHGLQNLFSLLDGARFMQERNVGSGGKCYEYIKEGGQKVAVAWRTNWSTNHVTIPTGSDFAQVIKHGGSSPAYPESTYNNTAAVTFSYSLEQKYLLTGPALYWKEGEDYTWSNSSSWSQWSHSDSYDGKHLALFTNSSGTRYVSYTFDLASGGHYNLRVVSSPGNTNWASPFEYRVNIGSSFDYGSMQDGEAEATSKYFGTSNVMAWRNLGGFNLPAGTVTITFKVDSPRSLDGKHAFFLDAIYLEREY